MIKKNIPKIKNIPAIFAIFISTGPSFSDAERLGPHQALFLKPMEPIHKPDVTQAAKPIQYINSCNCNMGFLLNFYKVFLDLLNYLQEVMFLEKN